MNVEQLTGTVSSSLESVTGTILHYLPNVLGAVMLLLLGWLLAWLAGVLTRSLSERGLRRLSHTRTIRARVQQSRTYQALPTFVGRLVFWVILLFFVAASVEALGLPAVSNLVAHASAYLPRVLAAVLIMFAGFWMGDVARSFVGRAAATVNVERGDLVGQSARGLVLALAAIVAIDQLGVDSSVLITVLVTIFATTFGAAALAFGLGARQMVANIIGAHYFRQSYRTGDRIRIGDLEGTVLEISHNAATLETTDGRLQIPCHRFVTDAITLIQRKD